MLHMNKEAFELVEELFANKVDKGGNIYINHLLRVASKMKDRTGKTIALLHDVIEDTDMSAEDLLDKGFSPLVVDSVVTLSRKENETYSEFIERIIQSKNKLAIQVKLADLEDNMDLSRIAHPTQKDIDRVKKRYQPAYIALINILNSL